MSSFRDLAGQRPYSDFSGLLIECVECGHTAHWHRQELRRRAIFCEQEAVQVAKKLYCPCCRAEGGDGKDLSVRPWPPIHRRQWYQRSGEQTARDPARTP